MRALLVIWILLPLAGMAQSSSFVDMQNEMMALIERQQPQLERMQRKADDIWRQVSDLSNLLKYPKNIPLYRDSSLTAIVMLRKQNDNVYYEAQDLWFEWKDYNMHLMAVYTRFGELKAEGRIDDNLRNFLLKYRDLDEKLKTLLKKVQDVYNESDFLLNTKLN